MRAHRHANVLGLEIHVWMCCRCSALFHYYAAFLCLTTFTPFTYTTRASVVRFSEPFRIALAGCVEVWVEVLIELPQHYIIAATTRKLTNSYYSFSP